MKNIIIIKVLLLFIFTFPTSAQLKSKFVENPNLPEKIDGFSKGKKSDMGMPGQKMALNIMEISAYNDKLEKLSTNELMQKMVQGGYGITPYVNDKNEVKVLVLSELPEAEKVVLSQEQLKVLSQPSSLIGKAMPNISTIIDINGVEWTSNSLKDKVVVINFWFKECKPCIAEMPELNKLVEQYKNNNVIFLAFALNSKEDIKKFLEKSPFNYIQIPSADEIKEKFEVNSFPFHAVVDKKGIVQFTTSGLSNLTIKMLSEKIEKALI